MIRARWFTAKYVTYCVNYYGCICRTTSLAIEFLSQVASQPEWEDTLYVDVNIINMMVLWLCAQQNVTTGAFPRTAYVYDIKLHVRDYYFFSTNILYRTFIYAT